MLKGIIFLILCFLSSITFAHTLTLNVTLHPMGSFQAISDKLKGEVKKLPDGSIEAKKISVAITSLKTDIDLRDEHLWKYLHPEKNPKVTLLNVKGKQGKAHGQLEVNGISRPIEITYTEKGDVISAKFLVKTNEFKLPAAEYMGVGVDKKVEGEAIMYLKESL